jgi:uncharacterized phiE125 gp8 family phage protein
MMLIEETGVSRDALPLAEFKAHLRLGTGFAEEGLQEPVLESFLRAAIAAIEARTGKVLIRRVFHWTHSEWRAPDGQPMPVAPVTAITSLTLHSRDGDHEGIGPAFYRLEADAHRPVLRPQGAMLPAIPRGGTAEIVFEAGFSENWAGLPADLAQAVLLLAAHYYEYRDETALGGGCMPFGVSSLIERYRTVRLFHGSAG